MEHRPSTTPRHCTLSWLLRSFRTSWSPAVSALLHCLASNRYEAGLSFSSPAGSRSGLGVWCWMLASWGCVRSSPTSSAVSAWPLVPVPLAATDLHFVYSLATGFCRWASDRCWRMSGSFVTGGHIGWQECWHVRWLVCWLVFDTYWHCHRQECRYARGQVYWLQCWIYSMCCIFTCRLISRWHVRGQIRWHVGWQECWYISFQAYWHVYWQVHWHVLCQVYRNMRRHRCIHLSLADMLTRGSTRMHVTDVFHMRIKKYNDGILKLTMTNVYLTSKTFIWYAYQKE